jgi:hypothetical protein
MYSNIFDIYVDILHLFMSYGLHLFYKCIYMCVCVCDFPYMCAICQANT